MAESATKALRILRAAEILAAAAAFVCALTFGGSPDVAQIAVLPLLIAGGAAAVLASAPIAGGAVLTGASIFAVAAALILPSWLGMLAVVPAGVVDGWKRRTGALTASMNIGLHFLAAGAARLVVLTLMSTGFGFSAAAALAGVVWLVVNLGIVCIFVAVRSRQSLLAPIVDQESLVSEGLMVVLGISAAVLFQVSGWLILIGVAPALIIRRALHLPLMRAAAAQRDQELAIERTRREQLEEIARLREAFVATVTHDLRSPLTAIMGYANLIEREDFGQINADQARAVKVIDRNAEHLLALTDDLLVASSTGELTLERRRVDLAEVTVSVAQALSAVAANAGVELRLNISHNVPVVGDRRRLHQVVTNLMSNAIKYTPERGAVEVTLLSRAGVATLSVRDTGIGMSAADLDRLFERYFRAATAIDNAIPGTGIGLAIVKQLTEAHGGTIDVQSVEGEGSTFAIHLPLAADERSDISGGTSDLRAAS